MRALLAAALITTCSILLAGSAEAARAKSNRYQVCDYRTGVYACHPRGQRSQSDEMDEIKANSLDPAGDLKGYPAWARRALSPKYDGGYR